MYARITIGMPVSRKCGVDIRTAAFCAVNIKSEAIKWVWSPTPAVEMGRNSIVEGQMQDKDWGFTHIFFLDNDVVPAPDAIWRLFSHDKPIVAGIYPMRMDDEGNIDVWSFKHKGNWWQREVPLPNRLIKADAVGGSTVLIKREVFEKMGWPWYKMIFKPMDAHGMTMDTGEDVFFCKKAIEAGYDIWVDPSVACHHYHYRDML